MNDDKLKHLKDIKVPEPRPAARDRALAAAALAFEQSAKKTDARRQGVAALGRLMITFLQTSGEWIMERRVIVGAAAAALLIVPFATTLYWQQYHGGADIDLPVASGDQTTRRNEATSPAANPSPATPQPARKDEIGRAGRTEPKLAEKTPRRRIAQEAGQTQLYKRAMPPAPMGAVAPQMAPLSRPRAPGWSQVMYDVNRTAPGVQPADRMVSPQQTGRDQFERVDTNPVKAVAEHPVSTFSIDVDTASYAFVRRMLNNGRMPRRDAVRVEEMINYFSYDYPKPENAGVPFRTSVAVYPTPWNARTRLMHIGIKGFDIAPVDKPAANLVFLIDVSGSMHAPDKLPLLKNAFKLLVNRLAPDDTVAIVTYAGAAGTVLEPTPAREKYKILSALERLRPGGSTAGAQGIRQAYSLAQSVFRKNGINRVILASDGDFNVGITDRNQLKDYVARQRRSGISLSVLGFGTGNYNDALMQTLAQNGNGNAAYIDTLREARKVLVDQAAGTLFTIAKDVKIQIEFNPVRVAEYRLIGYETRALKRADFNNDRVDAGEIGSGHTVTAIYEITPAGSMARLIDDLRYKTNNGKTKQPAANGGEYAFLKLRYKLPKESKSRLITIPVTDRMTSKDISGVSADMRFAASVAAFGQKLRGTAQVADFSYGEIHALASAARGRDEFGYRSEFLSLVRLAESLDPGPVKKK